MGVPHACMVTPCIMCALHAGMAARLLATLRPRLLAGWRNATLRSPTPGGSSRQCNACMLTVMGFLEPGATCWRRRR